MLLYKEVFQVVGVNSVNLTLRIVSFHVSSSTVSCLGALRLRPLSLTHNARVLFFFFLCCAQHVQGSPKVSWRVGGLEVLPAEPSGDNPHTLLQAITDMAH